MSGYIHGLRRVRSTCGRLPESYGYKQHAAAGWRVAPTHGDGGYSVGHGPLGFLFLVFGGALKQGVHVFVRSSRSPLTTSVVTCSRVDDGCLGLVTLVRVDPCDVRPLG